MTGRAPTINRRPILEDDLRERVEALRRSPSLGSMSEPVLTTLAQVLQPVRCAKGDVIIRQGELVENLSVVLRGAFEVRLHTESGAIVPIASLHAGDCSGEMALLTGELASADVIALEESEVLSLHRDDFEALITEHPNVLRQFVRLLAHRLRATNTAVGVARELGDRLTHFIIEEGTENGGGLFGKHAKISAAKQQAAKLAAHDLPVFIHGEPGTGKEAVARLIHFNSARKSGPLLSIDCRQITESPWGDRFFGAYQRNGSRPEHRQVVCYKDMAEGGTVFLNDIDQLPASIQERLVQYLGADGEARARGVRIIANSEHSLAAMAKSGQMAASLAKLLADHQIVMPPLREHKRDIPEMALEFAKAPAAKLGKQIKGFSSRAATKLVSHEYRYGNVRELKEAIERAVILTEGDTIHAEEIFLGVPSTGKRPGFNLLSPALKKWSLPLLSLTRYARLGAAAVFLIILFGAFFSSEWAEVTTTLVWAVWWPALIISFLVAGRMWCAVCPMALAGEAAQQTLNLKRRLPAWIENNTAAILAAGFFGILWVEEVSGMRQSPVLTGVLLLCIIAGAVAASVLFPRRTWCLRLCPLGGFAGLCAQSSIVEIRPTFDVCSARCTGHMCYKGDEKTPGCPMHSHLMFVSSNHDCVMCLNCVRLCPNGSPQFNIRVPAGELADDSGAEPGTARTLAMLSGLLPALLAMQWAEQGSSARMSRLLAENHFLWTTLAMAASAALPVLGLWLLSRARKFTGGKELAPAFWKMLMAWVPLVTTGYAAYQFGFVPGLAPGTMSLALRLDLGSASLVSLPMLVIGQLGLITAGLAITWLVFWKLIRSWDASSTPGRYKLLASHLAGSAAYWALLIALMTRPL